MLKAACCTLATVAFAAVCYLWRSRKESTRDETPPSSLDGTTGALVKYCPPRDASVEEEVIDNRIVAAPHQSLVFYFEEAWCQIDSWLRGGAPVATVGVVGGLTVFFVDLSVSEVYVSRTTGAAMRPENGEGILLLVPDVLFTSAPIERFMERLSLAAAAQVPLHEYDQAVASFFVEYGVQFPPSDLRPYWLVGLPALF
ncbi:hypothetical protein BSKO_04916 [Bryopsis sp. KO-2023]|nr:hypothetical protein BSKO_04916 [Bryopsis sp. KO-2023]